MITFYCKGGREQAAIILQNVSKISSSPEFSCCYLEFFLVIPSILIIQSKLQLRVFTLAESLGAVESLAESPSLMTHASVPVEKRAELGIDDSQIRLSVGVESCRDLINDLGSALDAARRTL